MAKLSKIKKQAVPNRFSWGLVFWPSYFLALYLGLAYYLRSIHVVRAYPAKFQALVDYQPPRPPQYYEAG